MDSNRNAFLDKILFEYYRNMQKVVFEIEVTADFMRTFDRTLLLLEGTFPRFFDENFLLKIHTQLSGISEGGTIAFYFGFDNVDAEYLFVYKGQTTVKFMAIFDSPGEEDGKYILLQWPDDVQIFFAKIVLGSPHSVLSTLKQNGKPLKFLATKEPDFASKLEALKD